MAVSHRGLRFLSDRYPRGFDIEVFMEPWVYVACSGTSVPRPSYCPNNIVVAVDGACSYNGTTEARASLGVYWGHDNIFNTSEVLSLADRQTSQVAELQACLRALEILQDVCLEHPAGNRLSLVVIKSDSEYLVQGITEWFPRWRDHCWVNSNGTQVVNRQYFEWINDYIQYWNRNGVSIKFWHVPRSMNRMADALAKDALL